MAVALFPLGEGETLGSNIGRYASFMRLNNTSNLMKKLFGYACTPDTRLPSGIDYLAEQTADYWNLSGEEIVKNFTGFQYITLMCSKQTRERLLRRMLGSPGTMTPLRLINPGSKRLEKLRYCPECVREWRSNREPCYWKIDHQLTGVYFCTKHSCILQSVEKLCSVSFGSYPVEDLIEDSDRLSLEIESSSEMAAVESVALRSVEQRKSGSIHKAKEFYLQLFRDAGFVSLPSYQLKRNTFVSAWESFFGKNYCHLTGMSYIKISTWCDSVTESAPHREIPHPFMYIAADCFLNHHISLPGSFLPKIIRRHVDLAKTVDASDIHVKANLCTGLLHRGSDAVKYEGVFRKSGEIKLVCTCGISYKMAIGQNSEVEKLVPYKYGSRYQTRLRALVAKRISVREAAGKLKISETAARKWLSIAGGSVDSGLSKREIDRMRREWGVVVTSIVSERRITDAGRAEPQLYKTLFKYDHDWLLKFNKSYRSWRPQGSYKTTQLTVDAIKAAYNELLAVEPPVRVTKTAIVQKAGARRAGHIRQDQPSAALLQKLAEPAFRYRERVLSWLLSHMSGQTLGMCDEVLRSLGLRLRSFTKEQRRQIRDIG